MGSTAVKSLYLGWLAAAITTTRCAPAESAGQGENLVLGYATGYDTAQVAIFVRSLRAHYQGPCALVVDRDDDLRAFLASYNIEALDAPAIEGGVGRWSPHPVVERFAGFDALLCARPWVGAALLTDVRDVVFQSDPFAAPVQAMEFFAECEAPLGQHAFDLKYLRAMGGDALTDAVSDRPCICVGTVLGPRDELRQFCRVILMMGAVPRSELGGAFGADQACCNLAVHLGLVGGTVFPNHSRVATVGMVARELLTLRDSIVVNPDDTISPILHQYDRHPDLMMAIWSHWAGDYERRDRHQPRDFRSRINRLGQSIRRRTPELR